MNKVDLNRDDVALLIVSEDLNNRTVEEFSEKMTELLEQGYSNIILEFSNVRYIISEAIGEIVGSRKVLKNRGGEVIFINVSEYIKWALSSCYGKEHFPSYETLQRALDSISAVNRE